MIPCKTMSGTWHWHRYVIRPCLGHGIGIDMWPM
ncbi:hypothetical protein F383_06494 [Gossypium arboreum]|uniref:Uncharacterized protein n=1 Tax=Gossypium arboreum TaxID=29729 RepID=A0A0B0NST7_GOSAR|nr:hypothetical protein F383_06494 [Gossypium arboreum]